MTESYVIPRQARAKAEGLSEDETLYSLLTFDPGGTTGWAIFVVRMSAMMESRKKILSNIAFWSCGEIIGYELDQVDEMLELASLWPRAQLLHEDFTLLKANNSDDLLSPVRLTFGFEWGLRERGDERVVIKQSASLALTTFTKDRLEQLGFAQRTHSDHERSGISHGLTWLRRKKKLMISAAITDLAMSERNRG
jgi:hypothetical protein